MTRFCGSPARNSTTCDPTCPAPPVTRIVRAVIAFARRRAGASRDGPAPDRVVLESQLGHAVHRVEIPPVDDDRPLEDLFDACEVGMPVLVPVGDDSKGVGARCCLIA